MAQPIWNTPAGSMGLFPNGFAALFNLSASAVAPATTVTYTLISGALPTNIVLDTITGLLSGTPPTVTKDTLSAFTVRATDNLGNIRDRSFTMSITGNATPKFTTPNGSLKSVQDSVWTQLFINYSNPTSTPTIMELQSGILPPGLELSPEGFIQGYAEPPVVEITLLLLTTYTISTSSTNNYIYCGSVLDVIAGRTVEFEDSFGGLIAGVTYYVTYVDVAVNAFTVATTQFGDNVPLVNALGFANITFPQTTMGQPAIRTYSFSLRLSSILGSDTGSYNITVVNQTAPVSQGGTGNPPNSRNPTILNTRPLTITIPDNDQNYGYYILPPVSPSQNALIGNITSGDFFAFKI